MTTITKPISRKSRDNYAVLFSGQRKARQIVVTLLPGDFIEFREAGRRGKFMIPIEGAFRFAVRCHALQQSAEKARKRKDKYRDKF